MIGIIDVDGKLPNLALMKISAYFKAAGETVEFVRAGQEYEKIYAAALFTRSKEKCGRLVEIYGDKVEIGGTGWDVKKRLPEEIEAYRPDYDLYTAADLAGRMRGIGTREHKLQKAQQIVDAGIGFTSRGCVRKCGFCFVPAKEGAFRQETPIADIINPRSNIIILNDNNLTKKNDESAKRKEGNRMTTYQGIAAAIIIGVGIIVIAMCKVAGRADMIEERQYIENWNAGKRGQRNDDN